MVFAPQEEEVKVEKRSTSDRRSRPSRFSLRYWLSGRRRGGRRSGEDKNIYVDRYAASEWFLVFGVLALSLVDLVFTLLHLSRGAVEANPIMALALRGGNVTFGVIKLGITILCLVVLLVHVRFLYVRGLLAFAFLVYAFLFVYHRSLAFIIG